MKDVAVVGESEAGESGIGVVEEQFVDGIRQRFDVERVCSDGPGSYPLSRTVHNMKKMVFASSSFFEFNGFERVFVPAQNRLLFDPCKVEAEVMPYVHDIFPVTRCYESSGSVSGTLNGYPRVLNAVEYARNLANCSKVVAASKFTASEIMNRTAFSGEIEVVYQGVDHLPSRKGIDSGVRDIDLIYVGSTSKRKNPGFLRSALQKAVDKGFNVVTVGFEDYGLPGDTCVNVSNEKLAELYSRSRFYLQPSLAEGFGRGPVEAQRYGCIPIALNREFNHEMLGEKGSCWLCVSTPDEAVSLLEANYTDLLRQKARKNSNRFRWDRAVDQLVRCLE